MSRIQKKQYRWFTLLTVLAVVVGGLWVFNPATQATAATQYLGGYTRTDDLRIQVLDNGRIGVERYTSSGSWERQIYATTSKGSRLYWSGGNVGLGYFSGSSPTLAYNNVSSTGSAGSRTWTSEAKWTYSSSIEVIQTLVYREGDPYFKLTWAIKNTSGSSMSDVRFFHGEDTYLRNGDNGAGWVDWANYTIGVKKNVSGSEQRMSLQGITQPYKYQSNNYYQIYQAVNNSALTGVVDGNESTDNGYALEWRNSSLAAGQTWSIIAYEKFNNAVLGAVTVSAPVSTECLAGSTCAMNFTVRNPGSSALTGVALQVSSNGSWAYTTSLPGNTGSINLAAGASSTVTVNVTVPSNATANSGMNVTLAATYGSSTVSETGAINAVVPANSAPSSVSLSSTTIPENQANYAMTVSGVDPDGDTLTYTLLGTDAGSFTLSGTTLTNNAAFNYEAKSSYSITIRASDGKGGTKDQAFPINVSNVNEAPTLNNPGAQTKAEDVQLAMTLTASDPDAGATLTWSVVTAPTNGSLVGVTGTGTSKTIYYNSNQDYYGSDSFRIQVTDNGGLTSYVDIPVTITAVNDAPVNLWNGSSTFGGPLKVRVNQTITFAALSTSGTQHNASAITVSDVDAGTDLVQVNLSVTKGALALGSTAGISGADTNGADGTFSIQGTVSAINQALSGLAYTPNSGYSGADTLTIITSDLGSYGAGGAKTDTDTISLTVSNPTSFLVDDNYTGSSADWGWNTFASIEVAMTAADSVAAINGSGGPALTMTVNAGDYANDGVTLNNAKLTLNLAGAVTLGKDFALTSGAFNAAGYPVSFVTGPSSQTNHVISGAPVFADLSAAAGNTITLADGANLGLSGALSVPAPENFVAALPDGRTTVTLSGSPVLPSGLRLDNLTVAAGATFNAPAALTLTGSLTNNGLFDGSGGTLTFAGPQARNQTISGTAPQLANVTINADATVTAATPLFVTGNWTDNGSYNANHQLVTFNGSSQAFNGQTVFDDVTVNDGAMVTLGNLADFGYTGAVTLNGSGMIDPVSGTDTIFRLAGSSSQTLPVGLDQFDTLAVNTGATLDASGRDLTIYNDLDSSGFFTNTSGSVNFSGPVATQHEIVVGDNQPQFGDVSIASGNTVTPTTGKRINVSGNWTDNGTFIANGGNVSFNGAGQTFTGETDFYDIGVNGTSTLTLAEAADFGYAHNFTLGGSFDPLTNADTIVRITGSTSQTMPAAVSQLHSLVIDAGAILNIDGKTLTLRDDLINNGSFSNAGGTLNFANGAAHDFVNADSTLLTQYGTLNIASGNTLTATCAVDKPVLVRGNWNKAGSYMDESCEVVFNGTAAQAITGTGNTFYDLTVRNTSTFPNDTNDVDSDQAVTVTHDLAVITGQFQPATGSSFSTVALGGNAANETGILRPDRNGQFSVSGDWTRNTNGWFDANAGTVDFTGAGTATIAGGATFYNLTINKASGDLQSTAPVLVDHTLDVRAGTFEPSTNSKFHDVWIESGSLLKPAGNINISGYLKNDLPAGYDHNEKSVTFDGSGIQDLTGRVDFYNLTINEGSTLRMATDAILGYAGDLVLHGSLDTAAHQPNTVEIMGQGLAQAQTLPSVQVNNLKVIDGAALLLDGNLTVSGNMVIEALGDFDAGTAAVSFIQNATGTPDPTFTGVAHFNDVDVASSTTLYLLEDSDFILGGAMIGAGKLDGKSQGNDTTVTIAGSTGTLPTGSLVDNLIVNDGATLDLNGKTLNVYGNWTNLTGSTLLTGGSEVLFKGGDAQALTGAGLNFDQLIVSKSAGSRLTSDVVTTSGDLTMNSGEFQPACGSVFNAVVMHGGELLLDQEAETCQVVVRTDWTQDGGTFSPNGGTVAFDAEPSGPHTLTGSALTFDGFNVGDSDTINLAAGANLDLTGPVSDANSTWNAADGSTLTISGPVVLSSPLTVDNLVISPTGHLTAPVGITLNGDLTVQSDAESQGVFDNSGGSLTLGPDEHVIVNSPYDLGNGESVIGTLIAGDLNIPSGSTLTLGTAPTSADVLTVAGNWTNEGAFTPNQGTVVFAGSDDQVIKSSGASNAFYNLVIANTKTEPIGTVTSMDASDQPLPLNISNDLLIQSGKLIVPDGSQLKNVSIEPLGQIEFGGTVTVDGRWDNRGEIVSGTLTEGSNFYLATALVDTAYTAGTPGFGFDKFDSISAALAAASDTVYIYNSADQPFAEDLTMNGTTTSAKAVVMDPITVNSVDLQGGELVLNGATGAITAAGYSQVGGQFTANSGSLTITGNFGTSDSAAFALNSGTLNLTGNFDPAVGFDAGTGTVVFNGAAGQTLTTPAGFNLYNVTIVNTGDAQGDDSDAVKETSAITISGLLDIQDGKYMPVDGTQLNEINLSSGAILKLDSGAQVTVVEGGSLTRAAGSILNLNGGKILGLPQSIVTVDDDYTAADSGYGYDLFNTIPNALTALEDINDQDMGVVVLKDGTYPGLELTNPAGEYTGQPRTLRVDGTVVIGSGDLTITEGALEINAGQSLTLPGNLVIGANGSLSTAGAVVMQSSTAQSISGSGLSFFDLTVLNDSGSEIVSTNAAIAVTDDLLISDGIFVPACGSSFKNVTIAAGAELRLPAEEGCAITVSGTWSVSAGSTFTPNGATVNFSGPNAAIDGLAVFDNLVILEGAILTADADDALVINGNWTNNGGVFDPNGGEVRFNGSGSQSISGSPLAFNDLTFGAGTAVTLNGNLALTGDWTQDASASLDANGHSVTFNGDGPQTLTAPDSLVLYDLIVDKGSDSALSVTNELTISDHLEVANGELILHGDTHVHNASDSATGHLGENAKLTLADNASLWVDDWTSDGGTVDEGTGQLVVAKITQVYVDDDYTSATPGWQIDRFASINDALAINYLAENAVVSVAAGTYAEDVLVNRTADVQFTGAARLNSLTLIDDGADPALNLPHVTAFDSGALTLLGSLTVTNGAFDPNGGEVIFSGAGEHLLTAGVNLNDLTIAADAAFAAPASLTLSGDLDNLGGFTANDGLSVSGSITNSGTFAAAAVDLAGGVTDTGSFTAAALNFTGTGEHTLSGSIAAADVSVPASNQLTLAANAALDLSGVLTLTDGASALHAGADTSLILSGSAQSLPDGLTLGSLSLTNDVVFTAPASLTLSGSLANGGTFTAGSGTVTFVSPQTQTISGNPIDFYNLVIDDANNTDGVNDTRATAIVNVTNQLSIADGKFSPTQCGQYANVSIAADGVFAPETDGTCAQAVSGSWVNDGAFTAGTSKVAFNGSSAQSISGAAQTIFTDLEFANTSGQAVTSAEPLVLNVTGELLVSAGSAAVPAGSSAGDVSIQTGASLSGPADNWSVSGDWNNQGNYLANNGNVIFSGSGAHGLSGETAFYQLTAEDGGRLNLADASQTTVDYGLDLQGAATLSGAPASTLAFTGSGMVSLPDGTTLGSLSIGTQTIFAAPANLTLQGGLANAGSFDAGEGTVTFLGTGEHDLSGSVAFNNLVLDSGTLKLAEGAEVTLNASLTQQNGSALDGSAADTTFIAAAGGAQTLPGTVTLNDLQVTAGTELTVPGALTLFGDLDVQGSFDNTGGSTTFSGPEGTIHYLTGNSPVTFGDLTIDPGNTLILPDGKVITVTGNWTNNGDFQAPNGTVIFAGSNDQTIGGSSTTTFDTVQVNKPAGSLSADTPVNVSDTLDLLNGSFAPAAGSAFGNVNITSLGTLDAPAGNLNVAGNWTNLGGFSPNGGTITFNGNGDQRFVGDTTFDRVAVADGSTLVLASNSTFGYTDQFTLAPTGNLDAVTNPGTTLVVAGDGDPIQTLPDGLTLNNLVVANPAILDGANTTVNLQGDLTVDGSIINGLSVNFLGEGEQQILGTGAVHLGNVTIGPDATLNPGDRDLYVSGDWTNNNPEGGFIPGNGNVIFEGTEPQTIGGETITTFNDLTIAGGPVSGPVVVSGDTLITESGSFQPSNGSAFENVVIDGVMQPEEGATLQIGGNWTDNGVAPDGGFLPNGSTLVFNSDDPQTIGGTNSPIPFNTLVIAGTGGVDATAPVDVTGDLRLETNTPPFEVPDGSSLNNVTINEGATLRLEPGAEISLNGTWNNQGTYDANGGSLSADSHPSIDAAVVDPNCIVDGTCGVDRFATIQEAIDAINQDGTITVLAGTYAADVDGVTINMPSDKAVRVIFSGDAVVEGDIIQGSGTIQAPTGTLSLRGDFNQTGGAFNANGGTVVLDSGAEQALSGQDMTFDTLQITNGSQVTSTNVVNTLTLLDINDGSYSPAACGQHHDIQIGANGVYTPTGSACINLSGNWTNDGAYTPGSAVVTFNGDANQTIGGSVDTTFANLVVDNSGDPGSVTVGPARTVTVSDTLTVTDGEFIPSDGSDFNNIAIGENGALTPEAGGTITISGNVSNQGSFDPNGGTVVLDGTQDQTFDGPISFYDLVVNLDPATTVVDFNDPVTVEHTLDIQSGVVQFPGGSDFADVQVGANGTLAPDNGASFSISGDWTNAGTFIPNQSTVIFDGSDPQTVSGVTDFYNLTLDNGSTLSFDAPIQVDGLLHIVDGEINPLAGTVLNNVTIDEQGILDPVADPNNPEATTIEIGGQMRNHGVFDLGDISATGEFSLDQVYVSPEYTEATPGYGVDHYNTIQEALALSNLTENATIKVYGGQYSNDVIVADDIHLVFDSHSALDGLVDMPVELGGNLVINHAAAVVTAPQGTLSLPGNLELTLGVFEANGGKVLFNGTDQQHILGSLAFYDLDVNNSADFTPETADDHDVDADSSISVAGTLHLLDGQFSPLPCSSFHTVIIDAGAILKPQAGSATCNSGLSVSGDWSSAGDFDANGAAVTFNGTAPQTISGEDGFEDVTFSNPTTVTATAPFAASGTLTITDGVVTLPDGATVNDVVIGAEGTLAMENGGTLTVTGDWTDENLAGGFDANDSTVVFNGGGEQTFTGSSTFANIVVEGPATLALGDNANLGYSGDFDLNNGGGLDATSNDNTTITLIHTENSPAPQQLPGPGDIVLDNLVIEPGVTLSGDGQNLTLEGDFTNNGTFNGGTGSVTFDGPDGQSQTIGGSGDTNFADLVISNDVTADGPVDVAGELHVTGDGTFTPADGSSFHDALIDAGGTLDGSDGTIHVTGDWNNNGSFVPGDGTVVFEGSEDQTISGDNTFNNLVINKDCTATSGEECTDYATVTVEDPITVEDTLTVSEGEFVQVQTGSSFGTIVVEDGGTLIAEDGATDINADHLILANPGSFQTPGGVFNPSNILWAADQTDTASVAEKPVGLTIGALYTIDLNLHEQNTFTYSLSDENGCGVDNTYFRLVQNPGDGLTYVETIQALDYETVESYSLCVETTDETGRSKVRTVFVQPTDANDEPVVVEDAADGSVDGQVTVNMDEDGAPTAFALTLHGTDQDRNELMQQRDTLQWQLISGTTHGELTIADTYTGNDLVVDYVPTGVNWNGTDQFVVRVTDGTAPVQITVHININAVNDPPINVTLPAVTPADSAVIGQRVQVSTGDWIDSNDPELPGAINIIYQWQRADDDQGTNTVDITNATESAYYPIASDQGHYVRAVVTARNTGTGSPAVSTTSVNSAWVFVPGFSPVDILLSHETVAENLPVDSLVARLSASDPDEGDQFTYELVAGDGDTDNAKFTISGNELRTAEILHLADQTEADIRVQVTDGGGNTYQRSFILEIVGVQTDLQPKSSGSLIIPNTELTPGNTVITVPVGAVLDPITIIYTPKASVDGLPEGVRFAQNAFDLTALLNGEEIKDYEFNKPFLYSIDYLDSTLTGMNEESLRLMIHTDEGWVDAACGEVQLDTDTNKLQVPICKSGMFTLVADGQQLIFLPFIGK